MSAVCEGFAPAWGISYAYSCLTYALRDDLDVLLFWPALLLPSGCPWRCPAARCSGLIALLKHQQATTKNCYRCSFKLLVSAP
jgi:hypothetical protein